MKCSVALQATLDERLHELLQGGESVAAAAKQAAKEHSVRRKQAYELALRIQEQLSTVAGSDGTNP